MKDNRLGMFIHWGLYAMTEQHEQAIARFDMPREEYEALAQQFNPVDYDPDAWVKLAKDAGMEYICFTTKHHDGFCMWDTKETDYNIMNTPYGKDVLAMLADACHRQGMKLSLYYSNPDWHHPKGYNPNSTHQWKAVPTDEPDTEAYRAYIKAQITELLTNYGEIYTLFWDIPPVMEDPTINQLARSLQPNILINDRGFDKGDFSTPEREYQEIDGAYFTRMTEACNAVDSISWGYRRRADFYTIRYLRSCIDRIMAMGGNYLLNVGPMANGVIDPDHADRIKKVGEWYNRVREGLQNVEPDTYAYEGEALDPYIAVKRGDTSYFHFYNGVRITAEAFSKYPKKPRRVRLLNTGEELEATVEVLPEYADDNGKTVIEFLNIRGIPADALVDEPIVLAVEW